MPHYLFRADYTQSGLQGMLKEGAASRVSAIRDLTASVGGSVESMYFTFGDS